MFWHKIFVSDILWCQRNVNSPIKLMKSDISIRLSIVVIIRFYFWPIVIAIATKSIFFHSKWRNHPGWFECLSQKRPFYFAYCLKLIFLLRWPVFPPLNGLFVSLAISLLLNKPFANISVCFFALNPRQTHSTITITKEVLEKAAYLIWEKPLRKFTVTNNSLCFNLEQSKWKFFSALEEVTEIKIAKAFSTWNREWHHIGVKNRVCLAEHLSQEVR